MNLDGKKERKRKEEKQSLGDGRKKKVGEKREKRGQKGIRKKQKDREAGPVECSVEEGKERQKNGMGQE